MKICKNHRMKNLSTLSIFILLLTVGCSEQNTNQTQAANEPKEPVVNEPKTPNTIDATNFCSMGSVITSYSAETATSFATDFIKQENIKESYITTYSIGLLKGQMAVASGNFSSSMQDLSYGTNNYSKQTNADRNGPFVTNCVKYIIE